MITNLRTITILMLLAGISLGIFASTLVARGKQTAAPVLDPRIENQVAAYRELYGLDEAGTDRVRRELLNFRHKVRQKHLELQSQHRDAFDALRDETLERIERIGREARETGPDR